MYYCIIIVGGAIYSYCSKRSENKFAAVVIRSARFPARPRETMADDDLDAFFEDVQEAEASAVEEKHEDGEPDAAAAPPPAKKQKIEPPVRPRGVVVAAASNKATVKPQAVVAEQANSGQQPTIPPPPPPPPPGAPPAVAPAAVVVGPAAPDPTASAKPSGKPHVRTAAGKTWVDNTLADWPDDDFRLFVGNLDPATTDAQLYQHFLPYASLNQVRVIRDKQGNSKGYGFVSLSNALECAKALREQDQTWLQSRPIRIKRSHWKDRELKERKKKDKRKHGGRR